MLLRGEVDSLQGWLKHEEKRKLILPLLVLLSGTSLYGAAIGLWRSPLQAGYVALKFPLVILVTTLGTALLNGMLAPLLGLNLRFRESLEAILLSFALAAAVLAAFTPVALFFVWNVPPLTEGSVQDGQVHALIKLMHVLAISFAGIAAHVRLWQFLRKLSGEGGIATRVLIAWLASNLFLGSQLVWILRPFIGAPWLPVAFLRPDAFKGNFYETVLHDVLLMF